jgi:hypothetical protein
MLGVTGVAAISYDRRAPVIFSEGEIMPRVVVGGTRVTVRWTVDWRRHCEGELSRQVVGKDQVIRAYRKRALRVPVNLGRQVSDTIFTVAKGLPAGPVLYEGIIRFPNCGVTSRQWPIEVRVPALNFVVGP